MIKSAKTQGFGYQAEVAEVMEQADNRTKTASVRVCEPGLDKGLFALSILAENRRGKESCEAYK